MVRNFSEMVLLYVCILFTTHNACGEKTPTEIDSGRVYLYNRKHKKAADHYVQRIKENPLSINAHRNYQNACFAISDSAKKDVAEYYRQLLKTDEKNPLYNYLYGRCLPCKEGMHYFEAALGQSSCNAWALNAKGACYFENSDLRNAKEEFLRAIKCKPDFGEAYQNLSQIYLQKSQFRRAKKVYRKLIARDRKNAQSYVWLGDMYLDKEMYTYAGMAYQKSVKLGAGGPEVFFKLAYTFFKERKYLAAMDNYKKSIECGNTRYEVYYNLGSVFELQDMPEEALDNYQQAYNIGSNHTTLYSMGNCAVQLGLYSKAIESYNRFLEKEPENREALTGLANAYQLKKEYDKAIDIYKKVIAIDNGYAKAYYNLGSIYAYYLKDYEKMNYYWGSYIKLFPHEEDSRFIKKEMEKINTY